MKVLFDAIEARYRANPRLVVLGRKIFEGQPPPQRQAGPYVVVELGLSNDLSTFASTIEQYDAEFSYFSTRVTPHRCREWLEEMLETFDMADLRIAGASCPSCRRVAQRDPFLGDNNTFWATMTCTIVVQRNSKVPVLRGA